MVELSWLVIGLLIAVAIILFKFKEVRHRAGLFTIIIVLLFFIITIGYISKVNNINLNSFDGISSVTRVYFSWLADIGRNLIGISGYAIKQDWGLNATTHTNLSLGKVKK